MKKFIFALSATTLLAACSFEQKPAPFEANNSEYFGKGNTRNSGYASNDLAPMKKRADSRHSVENEVYSGNTPDDYNAQIDQQNAQNAARIASRPLAPVANAASPEVYSHQVAETPALGSINNTISSRPLSPIAIDGDQQVVTVGEKQPLRIQPKINTAYDLQRNQMATAPVEETIPPLEGHKPGYLNLSQVSEARKANDKLNNIKPLEKPEFEEEVKIAETKPAPIVETVAVEEPAAPAAEAEPEVVEVPKVPEAVVTATAPVAAPVAVAAEKPKITPVIQRVETNSEPAAGSIQKNTIVMMNKQEEEEEALVIPVEKNVIESKAVEPKRTEAAEAAKPKASQQFIRPVDGVVVSEFGSNKSEGGFNDGINIQAPEGTPVKAANGGTVVYSGNQLQGYGNLIIIRHPDGYLTAYSHLKELELKKGEAIKQGDVLGHVGKTGNVETPQLHFGIRKGREPVDPKDYL